MNHHWRAIRRKRLAQFTIDFRFVFRRTNEIWDHLDSIELEGLDGRLLQII